MAQYVWVKLTTPEAPFTEISLEDVHHVDGLKRAIKGDFLNDLKNYDVPRLILRAKRSTETDEQAVLLDDPVESKASVQQKFGNDFMAFVSVPSGTYIFSNAL